MLIVIWMLVYNVERGGTITCRFSAVLTSLAIFCCPWLRMSFNSSSSDSPIFFRLVKSAATSQPICGSQ